MELKVGHEDVPYALEQTYDGWDACFKEGEVQQTLKRFTEIELVESKSAKYEGEKYGYASALHFSSINTPNVNRI